MEVKKRKGARGDQKRNLLPRRGFKQDRYIGSNLSLFVDEVWQRDYYRRGEKEASLERIS